VHEVDDRRLGADLVEVLLWMHDVSDPRLIHDSCEVRRLDGRALVHLLHSAVRVAGRLAYAMAPPAIISI
jgi:hypothetical protein